MKFIDPRYDRWHHVLEDGGTPEPSPHQVLSAAQWQAVRGAWPVALPAGVTLPNDAAVETIAHDLPRLALVVLSFPQWTDGRAYSQARLLRARFRYTGEVRAVGDVVVDMLPLLVRTGFDAVVLRDDQRLDAARRAFDFFDSHYQGDVVERAPLFARAA
jgi:uncharacterized protein (DUF934 family)